MGRLRLSGIGKVTPEPEPINYVARLDDGQYWQMSETVEIPPSADFELGFNLGVSEEKSQGVFYNSQTSFSNYARLFTSDSYAYNILIGFDSSSAAFFKHSDGFNLFDGNLNRVVIKRVQGVVLAYLNGVKDSTEKNITDGLAFNVLNRYASSYLSGVIANVDLKIGGVITNEIPLTNKEQGATQLATVGSINATMINYTEDVWELENQPPQNTQQASFAPQPPKAGDEAEVDEGSWNSSTPIMYEYQWQLDGVDIIGATAKSLLILIGMVGGALRCVVKAINLEGFTLSITAEVEVQAL